MTGPQYTPEGVDLAVTLAATVWHMPLGSAGARLAPDVLAAAKAYAAGTLTESGLILEAESLAERSDVIADAVERWKRRTTPVDSDSIPMTLLDDGSMDTVIRCDLCGAEERFSGEAFSDEARDESGAFTEDGMREAFEMHECLDVQDEREDDSPDLRDSGLA